MKIFYKIILINILVTLFVSFTLYDNKEWYRGRIDFFVNMNKPFVENISNPEFLLEYSDYKLVGKVLSSKTFKNDFLKEINCSYLKNCDLIISWQYKRSAIHNFHMEFIANDLSYVKKALKLFPKKVHNFLNKKNRNVLEFQIKSLKKSIKDIHEKLLAVEDELTKIYDKQKIQYNYINLIKEYFKYIKQYINIKRKEAEINMLFPENNIRQKEIKIKEKIIEKKIKQLETTLFNNSYYSMKLVFLKDKLDTLTNTYIEYIQKFAFYKVLYEKGNIYYLFITDMNIPEKAEKPSYIFLFFWWIVFNIFLFLLFLLLRKVNLVRG